MIAIEGRDWPFGFGDACSLALALAAVLLTTSFHAMPLRFGATAFVATSRNNAYPATSAVSFVRTGTATVVVIDTLPTRKLPTLTTLYCFSCSDTLNLCVV